MEPKEPRDLGKGWPGEPDDLEGWRELGRSFAESSRRYFEQRNAARFARDVLLVLVLGALCVWGFFQLAGCATPQAQTAWEQAEAYRVAMAEDGVVSQEEVEHYVKLLDDFAGQAGGSLGAGNLWTVLYSLLFGVPASVAATNYARNRSMPGTQRKPAAKAPKPPG